MGRRLAWDPASAGFWQPDSEHRTTPRLALDLNGSPVRLDDGPDKAQSKAQPPLSAAGIAPEQPIPNARELIRGDANTGVADRQDSMDILPSHHYVDASPRGRVF